ncbi:amidohydrolase family protein [Tessaracoccus massiliensis]|uniref:amidohydrolase family protein n=1 Tax=Tessaracoccus massiliensis TaxID=1522311 RepID=UPI00058FD628|nr:amidohydrolase family protein [Tessaracoccus massiliensis]
MTRPLHIHGTFLPEDEPRDLWIVDGVLTDEPAANAETLARNAFVVPGYVDAHCHIGVGAQGPVDDETIRRQALQDLGGGTMLIRDAGSHADTRWVQGDETLPRLIRAGQHIARPKRYVRYLGVEVEPEQLVEQARHEARSGDGWVKLVGDWINRSAGDLAPLWPADIAAAAIEAAHDEGARVTAHCFGEQSVHELVAAGIDCIEHGTGLSDDGIDEMVRRGTALVPTMINLERFPQYAGPAQEKFPTYYAHMMDLYARRKETIGKAVEAGVQVYAGTDAGTVIEHGRIRDEIDALAEVGGSVFAIGAASWRSRTWLGADALLPGASADLIVLDADPRVSLETIRSPRALVLRGRVIS